MEDGETKGGAATAPPIDRPLPPTLPGLVPDDETWKLENVSCISYWRGGSATWSSEIELASSGLREKKTFGIKNTPNKTYK